DWSSDVCSSDLDPVRRLVMVDADLSDGLPLIEDPSGRTGPASPIPLDARPPVTSPDSLRPRRRATVSVDVGGVLIGSAHPVVVQSMTNTDTADADATAIQVARLAHAGSQLVRV